MSIYIHVGAPRTGTSFLRKHVFNNLENTKFYNNIVYNLNINI